MKTQDPMNRLRAADPVDPANLEGWERSERGREVLARALSSEIEPTEPRSVAPRSRHLALSGVGVAAAIVAAVLVMPFGTERGASAAAAEALNAAARVAEKQPAFPEARGYRYAKSEDAYRTHIDVCSYSTRPISCSSDTPGFSVLVPHVREIWIAPDGSGRLRVTTGKPEFFGPRDEQRWEAAGKPPLDSPGTSDETLGSGGLAYRDLSKYSTDPDKLYDQIQDEARGHGPSTDAEMFVLVGDLLRETVAPPSMRAALYRVAAKISNVELVGEVTDPAGRKGIAVARTSDDSGFLERSELVFDPDTSELLAERQILLERVDWADAEPGTVIGYAVYLTSGIVESTSQRPYLKGAVRQATRGNWGPALFGSVSLLVVAGPSVGSMTGSRWSALPDERP